MNKKEKIEALERCNEKLYIKLEGVVDKNIREIFDVQKAIKINEEIIKSLERDLKCEESQKNLDSGIDSKENVWKIMEEIKFTNPNNVTFFGTIVV